MIAIDLSKHEAPDANPKIILQIIFTENLVWDPNTNTTILFSYRRS